MDKVKFIAVTVFVTIVVYLIIIALTPFFVTLYGNAATVATSDNLTLGAAGAKAMPFWIYFWPGCVAVAAVVAKLKDVI
jgi:hypothetical protein